MKFGVLGPVEARCDGSEVVVGGRKLKALLAILLLSANEAVGRDRLIEGLWGEEPPPSAAHTLDDYVSRLRKVIGADRIATKAPGYRLAVEADELDLQRFDRHFRAGREALASGDPATALRDLDAALALWRGPALADILFEPFAAAEAERLDERRLSATEERIEAALALGRHADLISELERLVGDHPLRERLLGQLMLALYRGGRQAEALAAFQAARHRLAEELGLDPSPALRDLERRILVHDPSLGPPRAARSDAQPARRRPRRWLAIPALAVVSVLVIGGVLIATGTRRATTPTESAHTSQLVEINPKSGAHIHRVALPSAPAAAAVDGQSLWLADPSAGTVSRVDLTARTIRERVPLGGNPGVAAVAGGSVWVAGLPGSRVTRIDAATTGVTQTVGLGGASAAALAAGEHGLWVADSTDDALLQLDPATGGVRRTFALDIRPTALAIGAGSIWVADYDAHTIEQIDPRSGRALAKIDVGRGPVALAVGHGAVWIANTLDSTLSRIDPGQGSVVATIPVGSGPVAVALAGDAVWVANQYSGTVDQVDPRRNTVVRTIELGGKPTTIAAVQGRLWVGVQPRAPRHGGTLVLLRQAAIPIDPAVQVGVSPFHSVGLTHDGLVTFNHAGGPNGLQLVPDLAISLPTPTNDGRTYTFRLRPGIRYSDGRLLRATDFRRGIERALAIRSIDTDLLDGITGATKCLRSRTTRCDLRRGIAADDRAGSVTFRLVAPDPQFLSSLTNGGLAVPVPDGTPMRVTGFVPIPGTGPYKVASADRHHIRYVLNPRFREWSHAAQPQANPDQIIWRFGLSPQDEVRAIQEGRADWMADPVPGALLPTLRTRYASRLHSYPTIDTEFLQLNTRLPPFDDVRVRRALNLAIDRKAIVGIWGGAKAAEPTCQLLPRGVPGFRAYCPYTRDHASRAAWTAPDLHKARRLIAASGTRGARVTVWGWKDDAFAPPSVSRQTASALRKLGYRVRIRVVTHAYLADLPRRVFDKVQAIPGGWSDVTAYNFFAPWLSCAGALDHGWYCVPKLDRAMRRARSLEATRARAAARLWARIDREIVDQAALVPLVNPRQTVFLSRRVRSFQQHPYLALIAAQTVLR